MSDDTVEAVAKELASKEWGEHAWMLLSNSERNKARKRAKWVLDYLALKEQPK